MKRLHSRYQMVGALTLTAGLMLSFQNCGYVAFTGTSDAASQASLVPPQVAPTPADGTGTITVPGNTICNSFSSSSDACDVSHALVGNLYIEPRASLHTASGTFGNGAIIGETSVEAYLAHPDWVAGSGSGSSFVPYTVAMSTINSVGVPFASGFSTLSGQTVQVPDSNGNYTAVPNWFALDLFGKFHLAPGDAPGPYQLAVIADDGAEILYAPSASANYVTLVNDEVPASQTNAMYIPGTQFTRMGCSPVIGDTSKIIQLPMAADTVIPLEVRYFNGPSGLSFRLIYRPVPASGAADAYCETDVDTDPSTKPSSTPPSPILDPTKLTGWKDVTAANLGSF